VNARETVATLDRRALRFVFIASLLVFPWPFTGRAYGRLVAAVASSVLAGLVDDSVAWQPGSCVGGEVAPHDSWQLPVRAQDRVSGQVVVAALDLRRSGYLAGALLVALALATSLSWSRRWLLVASGCALAALLPLLPLLSLFSGHLPIVAFPLGPVERQVADHAYRSLVAPPGMAYAVPGLLWLLLVWLSDRQSVARAMARLLRAPAEPARSATYRARGRPARPAPGRPRAGAG
jgi:hypothetical protein